MATLEREPLDGSLSEENRQQEAARLQHGITVLNLFSQEVDLIERLDTFLVNTRPGTESRTQILNGASYQGDEDKLELARFKAGRRYGVNRIRRQALYRHALFLDVDARLSRDRVIIPDEEDAERVSLEHGVWRSSFASRHGNQAREMQRNFLEARVQSLEGKDELKLDASEQALGVNDVIERAILLTRALNAMARRSMLSGLGIAIADDQYNEAIYERYETGTPRLDEASMRKVDRLLLSAKRDFWLASGFPEIRQAGSMSEHLLARRAQKMWKEFAGQYEHSPQQKQRVKLRKQLKNYIPEERLAETALK